MSNKKKVVINSALDLMEINNGDYSFRDIASKADCSTTLITSYFGDKNGLNNECFDEICHRIDLQLSKIKIEDDNDNEKMKDYVLDVWDAFIDYIVDHPGQAKFYLEHYVDGQKLPSGFFGADLIVKKLLALKYDVQELLPNIGFITTLMRDVTHGIVIGIARGDFANIDSYRNKIRALLRRGL